VKTGESLVDAGKTALLYISIRTGLDLRPMKAGRRPLLGVDVEIPIHTGLRRPVKAYAEAGCGEARYISIRTNP